MEWVLGAGVKHELDSGEVHVWRATLDDTLGPLDTMSEILDEDERRRADRIENEGLRRRFSRGRGLLRAILSRYLAVEPAALRFAYGPQGKPSLAEPSTEPGVHFNVAHSQDIALYAVALGRRVGVDVERLRPDFDGERIAERFFSRAEVIQLRRTPQEAKQQAFFDCWTRKEAYIKATGASIFRALDSFDVSLAPGEPAALLRTHPDPGEAGRWSLRDLDVGPGYAAALAAEGHGWKLTCWQWPPSSR